MWRTGVLLSAVVLLEFTSAGTQITDDLLVQRLKRSPGYYGHRRHWPPPPPPECWPPHSPGYWPPPQPPPSPPEQEPSSRYSKEPSNRYSNEPSSRYSNEPSSQYSNEPCTENCGSKPSASGSVSNAKSRTGDAIAVAIAKGQ